MEEKTNEITAIPELIDSLNIKGTIITIDAMGTQTAIVKKIRKKRADYVLALKGNQGSLLEDVREYFSDEELLNWMEYIEDVRQIKKVRHKLKDILVIVLFATLANADDWVEMELFAKEYQDFLRKYIELKNGIPSHDTLNRVMGLLSQEVLQQLYSKWQELLNRDEGEALKKIIYIDGKTMRSNKRKEGKPSHIVSAWSREDGFCLGQKAVEEKSNEIPAIPKLLEKIQIRGQIVTIDAMGTQKEITEKIRKQRARLCISGKRESGEIV